MSPIDPKNLTALLAYRGRGNPPSTHPFSAIANCFPGLEFDFRNVWRRILVGVELHEADNLVVRVDEGDAAIRGLLGHRLVSVDGEPVTAPVMGPRVRGGPSEQLGTTNLEWANALANVLRKAGTQVPCVFLPPQGGATVTVPMEVRRLFVPDDAGAPTPVIAEAAALPGELTQSLCSPWQNDYLECACYYWAASRPDFVNAEAGPNGAQGHNWLHKNRGPDTPKTYSLRRADRVSYEDLFRNWEQELKFEIGGKDEG
jgi:hypothetical protein